LTAVLLFFLGKKDHHVTEAPWDEFWVIPSCLAGGVSSSCTYVTWPLKKYGDPEDFVHAQQPQVAREKLAWSKMTQKLSKILASLKCVQ